MKTNSLLRREEYKALQKISLRGDVLDVGGSKKSGYHALFGGSHTITTANIDVSYECDLVFDAEKTWPIKDGAYDAVLFINVLEHLFNFQYALREARRVTRPEGTLVIVVPFMFPVHGSPSDYHRFTRYALQRHLTDAYFNVETITELGSGAGGVVYHALIAFARFPFIATVGIALATLFDRVTRKIFPKNYMGSEHFPLGYLVIAQAAPNEQGES